MTDAARPPHGFPESEFEARVARAQRVMRAHGFDALLLTSPPDIRYVTGFETQFWESPTRPWFAVAPAEGKPVAVVPEIGAPEMARTWIDDVRSWPAPRPGDDGTSLLAATLARLPRRFGRIGAELGREMALRMPVAQFLELRDALPGLEIVDGSPCLWEIRRVKTPAEIERIRFVCRIASEAYEGLSDLISVGEPLREVCRKLSMDLLRRGADAVPFLPAVAARGGVDQIVCGPRDKELEPGDVLFIDTGSTYDGYFCDFDRNWAVGEIDDAARRANAALWDATEAGIAAARPGGDRGGCLAGPGQGSSRTPARSATTSAAWATVSACSSPNRRRTCRAIARCWSPASCSPSNPAWSSRRAG